MSWLYSRALVEEYSEGICSDGAPSALSNGKHTQLPSWCSDKTMANCQLSQSGMTFKPLTDDLGEAVLMSFLEAFPVRTLAAPAKAKASKETDHPCGNTWRESLEKFDLDTHTWKTHQCLWDEDLQPSSVILPKWGMMLNGVLWERTTLPRLTSEIEFGSLLPTPTSTDATAGAVLNETTEIIQLKSGRLRKISKNGVSGSIGLARHVQLWPTPQANEDAAGTPAGNMQKMLGNDPRVRGETKEEWSKGALNPTWVEWLMGWPIGWTSMDAIEELDWRGWETDPADDLPPKDLGTPRATEAIRSDEFRKGRTPSPEEYIIDVGAGTGSIPRVATGIKHRVGRLKAIGNGQVPQVAAMAWTILNN